MALIKKKTDATVMEKEYEGRCKMRVYDSISDWQKKIQTDKPIDPMTHIEDLYLRCDFDQDYIGSILKVNIRVCNLLDEKVPMKIKLYLYEDIDQEPIGAMDIRMVAQGKTTTKGYFEVPISTVKLWSDQEPNLYEVLVVMTDHFDETLQVVGFQYGFRDIKISGEKIWLNNKPLLIKGINYGGDLRKANNTETYRKDLKLLKEHNINALKVNGDCVDNDFFECCNQLGFFVVTEVSGLEHHKEGIISRAVSVIGQKRNHPCIIMWSLESTQNKNKNLAAKKVLIALDDSRPCMIHDDGQFLISDVFVMEKLHDKTIERIGKGLDIRDDMVQLEDRRFSKGMDEYMAMAYKKKPAILCTNRQISVKELINVQSVMDSMHAYTRWHGGFIGDFENYFSNKNHSGEKSYEIQPLAYEIKKAFEPYSINFDAQTAFYSIKPSNLLADDIEVRVIIQEDGTPIMEECLDTVCIKPGEVITGTVQSWLNLKNETVLYHIIFEVLLTKDLWWAKKGHVLASKQFEKEGYNPDIYMPKSSINCTLKEAEETIEVRGEKTYYEIDKKTGHITQIKVDHKALLAQPIQPIWKGLLDFDKGLDAKSAGADKEMSQEQVKAYRIEKKGSQVNLYFDVKIKDIKSLMQIQYEIFSTGELNIYYKGEQKDQLDRLVSRITLITPRNQVNWFGRGPHPSHLDLVTSMQMGLYQMDLLEKNQESNRDFQKGTYKDIRWMTVTGIDGEGIMVESMDKNGFDASFTTPDQETTTLLIKHTGSYRFLFMEAL
ncbi:MAG: DUF4981 domain-containing protein [Vallitaleaceae bacterium]|nr:DUF4981 domain-containing protein [Vallitaleaceae bacterium]